MNRWVRRGAATVLALAALVPLGAGAQGERLDIARFQVEGNTLLRAAEVERRVARWRARAAPTATSSAPSKRCRRPTARAGYTTVRSRCPSRS
jgi:hypothetical protein